MQTRPTLVQAFRARRGRVRAVAAGLAHSAALTFTDARTILRIRRTIYPPQIFTQKILFLHHLLHH